MRQSAEQLGALLDLAVPPASVSEAETLARARFGIVARAAPLSGEREGPHANILKIRPPLVFKPEHADLFLAALDESMLDITA